MKAQCAKTGSRTSKGDQSIQATIDRYATKYPQWHPCTHGHLRKWARTKPGVKPVKNNLHLRYFSMPGGQKKWAGQKSTVFYRWSLGKKANKTRRSQGMPQQKPCKYFE